MAKKWLSMILSIAMLLSCISGITLFTAAATEPYAWFDTAGGECTYDGAAVQEVYYDWEDPVAEEYGVRLSDGGEFVFGGELLAGVPAEQSVTLVLKYYIDGDITGTMFSYRIGDGNDEVGMAEDVAVTADDLVKNEVGTLYITLTEEDKAIATVEGDYFYVYVTGGADCADSVYIQSAKVVDTACDAMDDVDAFHAYMLANELNTKLVGVRDATDFEEGYTGDVKCVTCDATLKAGEPIPATSDLPAPYAYMTTNGGVKQSNVCTGWGNEAWSNVPVEQIPDTDEYGVKLTGDWQGFFLGGNLLATIPSEQSVTMVVEYYITGDVSGRQQLFRYQLNEKPAVDLFTDTDKLVGGKSGLVYYTFTAEDRATIGAGDMRFKILGCGPGANRVYIQSVRLVNTEYVHAVADGGYAVWDANEQLVCDYYPDITATVSQNMTCIVQPPHWNFKVTGDALIADESQNKPLYIKVKMKDTFTGDTFAINQHERYAGPGATRWAYDVEEWREGAGKNYRNFPVTNGEAAFILPETSFTNNYCNGGSFRLDATLAEQIERIEIYDLNTFCANEKASAEDIAEIHALFAAKNMNIEKVGRVEADEVNPGYTGDTVCLICDEVIVEGIEIPVIDPNRPFATLDTAGGNLVVNGATLSIRDAGNTDVVAIGDTGEYGIKLTGDWCGFNMNNVSMLGAAGKAALLIEYYIDIEMPENMQMFRYQIGSNAQVDIFTNSHNLASGKSGLVYHLFTEDEMAAIGDNAFTISIMGCAPGANATYVQSVKLVSADLLNLETDAGYAYTEFAGKPLTDLYPDIMAVPSYNLSYVDAEIDDPPGFEGYRYIKVAGDLFSTNGQSRPVYITLYAAEGYENDIITIGAIERTAGAFGAGAAVQMVDGVGSVFVPAATFTNKMNAGALRFSMSEAAKVFRIEILDAAAYCGREDADAALVEQFHEGFLSDRVNVNILGKKDPTEEEEGYTGDIYCATCNEQLATGTDIPKLEVSDLPDPYAYFDTANGTLKVGGTTLANQGVDPVALPIGGSGEYGIKLTGDWQGFRMEGMTLPTDTEIYVAIEYYIDANLTSSTQLFRYQTYSNMPSDLLPDGSDDHYEDIFSDQDNLKMRDSGLLLYKLSEEAVAAINAGDSFKILGCGPGANIVYVQSIRFVDGWYVNVSEDLGFDYMSFVEVPLCEYYPTITGMQSAGLTLTKTEEGVNPDLDNEPVRFGYFKVTQPLVPEGVTYRPVVLTIMMNPDCGIEEFQMQYQTARRDESAPGIEWAHLNVRVENGYAEITLEEACFDNGLNGLGSFRFPNHPSSPVLDNLLFVAAQGLADTSALKALVEGVEETVLGKTKESADAYRAVVEEYAYMLEDPTVTDEDVAAAIAAIEEAAAALVDCTHGGDTKLVGALEVGNHVVPGYTGDIHCAECNELLEEGEVIPAHNTEIRNIKDPTCKEPGNTGDRWCLDCDELVTAGDPIMQLPHKWDDGVVTKPATPDTKGETTITCTVCGETKITRFDFEAGIGDVDNNGKVDSTDARLVLQFAVKKITPSALNLDVADVDNSGKVDSTDARLILQYAVKKINKFPAE